MQGRKRLFLGLGLLIIVILLAFVLYLWYVTFYDSDAFFFNLVLMIVAVCVVLLLFFTGFGLFGVTLTILRKKYYPLLNKLVDLTVNLFFPLVIQVGKLFQITQVRIQRSFVEVNNQLAEAKIEKIKGDLRGEDVLLLLPHCLQNFKCTKRITNDINNCDDCGLCTISNLLELSKRYGVNVRVATGGTLARRFVKETKPKLILAVACERDLTSGILDASPLPVLGFINKRPKGPCIDTTIDVYKLENCLKELLEGNGKGECFPSTAQEV